MTNMSAYEKLYINMKNKFTIVSDNREYTLGEYMRMKADCADGSTLPAPISNTSHQSGAISAIFSYVNDKLTVKKEPVKDKTMRAFPFRTSLAACFSAVVACAFVFSFGLFSMKGATAMPSTVEAEEESSQTEIYDVQIIEQE